MVARSLMHDQHIWLLPQMVPLPRGEILVRVISCADGGNIEGRPGRYIRFVLLEVLTAHKTVEDVVVCTGN